MLNEEAMTLFYFIRFPFGLDCSFFLNIKVFYSYKLMCCKCHIIEAEIYNDCGNFCSICWNDITDSSPRPNSVLSIINNNPSWLI